MSDTPKTDAFTNSCASHESIDEFVDDHNRLLEFARGLERRLNAALIERDNARSDVETARRAEANKNNGHCCGVFATCEEQCVPLVRNIRERNEAITHQRDIDRAHIQQLESELLRAKKNVERYLYIRNNHLGLLLSLFGTTDTSDTGLDKAIDDARKRESTAPSYGW